MSRKHPLSISRVAVGRVMEDLLLQIVKEAQNAKLQNLRKAAQEASGNYQFHIIHCFIYHKIFMK